MYLELTITMETCWMMIVVMVVIMVVVMVVIMVMVVVVIMVMVVVVIMVMMSSMVCKVSISTTITSREVNNSCNTLIALISSYVVFARTGSIFVTRIMG